MLNMKIQIQTVFILVLAVSGLNAQDFSPSDTLVDIEGNYYKTVSIGTQTWMAENLRTSKYNDGSDIVYKSVKTLQKNTAYFYWYMADEEKYKYPYGGLYNWYAVNTGKLCPCGWHVPNEEEWTTLEAHLGGSKAAGTKMKEVGNEHWKKYNTGFLSHEEATNESGFSALPGGLCQRTFGFFGKSAFFWSSTDGADVLTYYHRLDFDSTYLLRNYFSKKFGLSIRCVKD